MTDLSGADVEVEKPGLGSAALDIHSAGPPLFVESRISKPEFLDWHLILDQELSQLSRPDQGVFGSFGFVGLGAAIGLLVPFLNVTEKIGATGTPGNSPLLISDVACIAAFAGSVVLSVVCLTIALVAWLRNRGLAGEIRKRTKRRT